MQTAAGIGEQATAQRTSKTVFYNAIFCRKSIGSHAMQGWVSLCQCWVEVTGRVAMRGGRVSRTPLCRVDPNGAGAQTGAGARSSFSQCGEENTGAKYALSNGLAACPRSSWTGHAFGSETLGTDTSRSVLRRTHRPYSLVRVILSVHP